MSELKIVFEVTRLETYYLDLRDLRRWFPPDQEMTDEEFADWVVLQAQTSTGVSAVVDVAEDEEPADRREIDRAVLRWELG